MWSQIDAVRKSTLPPGAEAVGKALALLMGAVLVFDVTFVACSSFIPGFAQHFPWTHWNQ